MSNTVILRKIYAFDSNTGLPISTNNVLLTDGQGGTNWISLNSALTVACGSSIGNLPSTLSTISTQIWTLQADISSLSSAVTLNYGGQVTATQLTSSITGLGSSGYTSTATLNNALTSTATSLTSNLTSSVIGLGSSGYVSSSQLQSTVNGLGTWYISTSFLDTIPSTIDGLGNVGYISSTQLQSSINSLSELGYISSSQLTSTVNNLGSVGYVSSASLVSTTNALSSLIRNMVFGTTGQVFVYPNATATFLNASNVVYLSSFLYSSLTLQGNYNTTLTANVLNNSNLLFTTASFDLNPYKPYITSNSRISIELYPTLVFASLGIGATQPGLLPLSTMLMYNHTSSFVGQNTSYLLAQNQANAYFTGTITASNIFTTPMRFEVSPNTVGFSTLYSIVHYMPGGRAFTPYENALSNENVLPLYTSTASAFISVQNL